MNFSSKAASVHSLDWRRLFGGLDPRFPPSSFRTTTPLIQGASEGGRSLGGAAARFNGGEERKHDKRGLSSLPPSLPPLPVISRGQMEREGGRQKAENDDMAAWMATVLLSPKSVSSKWARFSKWSLALAMTRELQCKDGRTRSTRSKVLECRGRGGNVSTCSVKT